MTIPIEATLSLFQPHIHFRLNTIIAIITHTVSKVNKMEMGLHIHLF